MVNPVHVWNGRLIYWYGTTYELCTYIIRIELPERKKNKHIIIKYIIHEHICMLCVIYVSIDGLLSPRLLIKYNNILGNRKRMVKMRKHITNVTCRDRTI